jgi:Family of unknown function (DUF6221)
MHDLVTWLRAQLDEDEQVAKAANPGPWRRFTDRAHLDPDTIFGGRWMGDMDKLRNVCSLVYSWEKDANGEHIARHDPARVLAEVEAKRRILGWHSGDRDGRCLCCQIETAGTCQTVRLLALPYADRPDFREEWRP